MVNNNINIIEQDIALKKIVSLLSKSLNGLTITEIVQKTGLSRSAIRTSLAKLEGAGRVLVRKIGMAKVYSLQKIK